MITKPLNNFYKIIKDLEKIVSECNLIITEDDSSGFVYSNANFLTKSFLVSLSGYLETYLKEVLELLINDYELRISKDNYPYNLIRWSIENKQKPGSKIGQLLDEKKRELEDFISGNPFRTKHTFHMFGIDLESVEEFNNQKEIINQIVNKRNKILHHNDDASDISNTDIIKYIELFISYSGCIDSEVEKRLVDKSNCI